MRLNLLYFLKQLFILWEQDPKSAWFLTCSIARVPVTIQ